MKFILKADSSLQRSIFSTKGWNIYSAYSWKLGVGHGHGHNKEAQSTQLVCHIFHYGHKNCKCTVIDLPIIIHYNFHCFPWTIKPHTLGLCNYDRYLLCPFPIIFVYICNDAWWVIALSIYFYFQLKKRMLTLNFFSFFFVRKKFEDHTLGS